MFGHIPCPENQDMISFLIALIWNVFSKYPTSINKQILIHPIAFAVGTVIIVHHRRFVSYPSK